MTNESRPTVMEIGISAYIMEVMVVESGKEISWVLIPLHTSNGLGANTTKYTVKNEVFVYSHLKVF